MNNLYASLEASKKLHDAGIVLKIHYRWISDDSGKYYLGLPITSWDWVHSYPAPSMAEVWRELPISTEIFKIKDESIAWYAQGRFKSANPTDALIDLLVYIRKEKS